MGVYLFPILYFTGGVSAAVLHKIHVMSGLGVVCLSYVSYLH
jgi:hypothetical protein